MVKNPLTKAGLVSFASLPPGQWVVIDRFGSPTKAYLYDGDRGKTVILKTKKGGFEKTEVDGVITLKGMTWPDSLHSFDLIWTEKIENKKTLDNAPEGKYVSHQEFLFSDTIIGFRHEKNVPTLYQKEIHPVAIRFNCKGGGAYIIVVQITVEIHNPIAAIQIKNFLNAAIGKVTEAIGDWGRKKTFIEAQEINVDDKLLIKRKDKSGSERFYLDVINEELGKSLALSIEDVTTLDHFIADSAKDLFQSFEDILTEENKAKVAEYQKQARLKLNEAQEKENETENKYQKNLLKEIKETQMGILGKMKEVAQAYGGKNGVTYLNLGGNNQAGNDTLEILSLLQEGRTKRKGGGNAKTS